MSLLPLGMSGFMSTELMLVYVDKIIKPYIGENKCLLVLDDYKDHKTEEILDHFSINYLQPFIIQPFIIQFTTRDGLIVNR